MEAGGLTEATMSTKSQQRLSASSLALLAIAFIAAISISNQLFSGWRIDLTENSLYTHEPMARNPPAIIKLPR